MVKKIASYIIIFLLIILLVVDIAFITISKTILNEKFVLKLLDQNHYYSEMYSEILEVFKNNTIQSGLDETILDGIMTEEQVENDIKSLVHYLYTGTEMSINTDGIKTKLQANIDEVIKENNKRVNSDERVAIDTYIKVITDSYSDGIAYAEKYISQVENIVSKIQTILGKMQMIPYIATLVVAILLLIMNKKESLKYFSIAFIATGILFIILKIVESSTLQIQNILILNQAFSNVLINTIQSIMTTFLVVGIVFSIIGILLSVIQYKTRKE